MEYIEQDCTLEMSGRTVESGGAVVTPDYAIGYLKIAAVFSGAVGAITDWHGNTLGSCHVTAHWSTPRSYMSSRMLQLRATIDGITYTGRCAGNGMIYKGKRVK